MGEHARQFFSVPVPRIRPAHGATHRGLGESTSQDDRKSVAQEARVYYQPPARLAADARHLQAWPGRTEAWWPR